MPTEPDFDRHLYRYQPHLSDPDQATNLKYSSGDDIRHQARGLGEQYSFQTDVWYPGLQIYQPADTVQCDNPVPNHSILSDHHLPDILIAGKRKTSESDLQDVPQLAADTEVDIPVFEVGGSERIPLMDMYELPTHTDQAATVELEGHVPEPYMKPCANTSQRTKSKRSSLQQEFDHLKAFTTVDSAQSAAAAHQPQDEDFGHLRKVIDVGHAPSPFVSPSSSTPSTPPLLPARSVASTFPSSPSPSTPATSPSIAAATIVVTAPDTPPPVVIAPETSLPLPPKPLAYQMQPAIGYGSGFVVSYRSSGDLCRNEEDVITAVPSPRPPLPPKPREYRPRFPINYEADIEAKYRKVSQCLRRSQAGGVWQEQRRRPRRREDDDEECGVVRVVNPDVPGWTY